MLTIKKLLSKFKDLNTDKIIADSMGKTVAYFEAEQKAQLLAGKDKSGSSISPKYKSDSYARKKNAMNPLPGLGVPDLKLSGSFQREIDVTVEIDRIEIISQDSKSEFLEKNYPNAFGLGGEFKSRYLAALRPKLLSDIKEKIGF